MKNGKIIYADSYLTREQAEINHPISEKYLDSSGFIFQIKNYTYFCK